MVGVTYFALATLSLSGSVAARRRPCAPSSASHVVTTSTNLLATSHPAATPTLEYSSNSVHTTSTALAQAQATDTSNIFKPGVTWDICIDYPIKHDSVDDIIPKEAKVWDIDLGHAHDYPTLIPILKKAGKFVICYFNAGAVQTWDADKDQFPDEVVGKSLSYPYEDEESYVDIRDDRVLEIMKARLRSAVDVGCDAVDPDNVDAWAQDGDDATGFNLKSSDYVTYLKSLATYAHSLKTQEGNALLVGQKNAPEIASELSSTLDFAVLEECRGTSGGDEPFCSDFQTYIAKNKPVLQIEYPPSVEKSGGTLSSADEKYYCDAEDDDKGFSKILKWASAQLDGWGQYCGGEPFKTPEAEDE